jgi:Uma2 family endonuclease
MTPQEFLAWEREQPERHILHEGEIYGMAGGTIRHARLGLRAGAMLDRLLRGSPCVPYSTDLRLSLGDGHLVYADVAVVCGKHELRANTKDTVTNPTVVVEVISKSTEAYGDKFAAYASAPSIQHIVFVAQKFAKVEVYTRAGDGSFSYRSFGPGTVAELSAIRASLSIDELYEGAFEIPGEEPEPRSPEGSPSDPLANPDAPES